MRQLLFLFISCSVAVSSRLYDMFLNQKRGVWEINKVHQDPVYCYNTDSKTDEMCELLEGGPRHSPNSLSCYTIFGDDGAAKAGCWEHQHVTFDMCQKECKGNSFPGKFCCCFDHYCNSPDKATKPRL